MIQTRKVSSSPKLALRSDLPIKIMMDSGAFSAWRLGKAVDLSAYCDYLQSAQEWVSCYAALDMIIPGDSERAAKESFDNLVYMRLKGLSPIPVFHVREDISWLKRMLDLGCDYIGLSATSLVSRSATDDWYALAWSHLVDSSGKPVVKVHAFGESRLSILLRFPWTSADSSTWINGQKHGSVYLPNGKRLSHRHDGEGSKSSQDIHSLDSADISEFDDVLVKLGISKSAFDERKGRTSMLARSVLAASCFVEINRTVNEALPITFKPNRGLVSPPPPQTYPAITIDEFDFYMAVGTNNSTLPGLHAAGARKLLASYFYMNPNITDKLKQFITNPEFVIANKPYANYHQIITNEVMI